MVVRLRLALGRSDGRTPREKRRQLLAFAALLQPVVLMAGVLAFWRFSADLHWTREFAISDGAFSHWQTWLAIGAALECMVVILTRRARRPFAPSSTPANETQSADEAEPIPLVKSEL